MKENKFVLLLLMFLGNIGYLTAQIYQDYIGAGHTEGVTVLSSSRSDNGIPENTINGTGFTPSLKEASRFLSQATLGADFETINDVHQKGFSTWLEEQFEMPLQVSFTDTTWMIWEHFKPQYVEKWGYETVVNAGDAVIPYWYYWRMAWWNNIMKSDDLLRQRAAQALSQILVVSEKSNLQLNAPGLANYYDVLYQHAFGNFRDLLFDVTMHPAMGIYLSHMNNPKSDIANNIHPDENYAREIMQLFSIGLFELNIDGTRKLDQKGDPIPTYDNNDIKEYAKIFTGLAPPGYYWPWEDYAYLPPEWGSEFNESPATINMWEPMVMFDNWHEPGIKKLLSGQIIPAGQTGMKDISDAVDNLFHHPNVGPFIGKLLIQRFIKSNPTPAYVARVAAAFNDNGEGVRGDMKAVFRAILMDAEARDCSWKNDPNSAKLREPLLRYTQAMRAFNAYNNSGKMWNYGYLYENATQQSILSSPSVFNFYLPEYQPNGAITDKDLFAPEFQIHTSATAIDYINLVYQWFFGEFYMEVAVWADDEIMNAPEWDANQLDPDSYVSLDLRDELALADNPEALLDRIDLILAGGTLSETTKASIMNVLNEFVGDAESTVRTALFMVMIAPDYCIQK